MGEYSRALTCRVFFVEYRLAPETLHPGGVQDAVDAYKWVISASGGNVNPTKVVVSGDSAGGGMVLLTLVKLVEGKVTLPAAAVAISPWTDLSERLATYDSNANRDALLRNYDQVANLASFVTGTALGDKSARRNPQISAMYANLSGFPPTFIIVGEAESMLDDSVMLVKKAQAQGTKIELLAYPNMQHIFPLFLGWFEEATKGTDAIRSFVSQHVTLQ